MCNMYMYIVVRFFVLPLQVDLFNNIKPLFANKPLMICVNKIDVLQIEDLPEDKKVRLGMTKNKV